MANAETSSGQLVLSHAPKMISQNTYETPTSSARFVYQSGYHFDYPEDGVRGIFLTAHSAGGSRLNTLVDFVNDTDLNAMVIDIKDDYGNITYMPDETLLLYRQKLYPRSNDGCTRKHLSNRIVVFKDSVLAKDRPDLSFQENGEVWTNRRGDAFVNPFLEEVWEYNTQVAIEAAKMGFKDIQFDYVRFPEGFIGRADQLVYGKGTYGDGDGDNVESRIDAVADFVGYAREELQAYGVDVSVDIFGAAARGFEENVGQDFVKISANVDVISSMPYPSHWVRFSIGNLDKPDLYPYEVMDEYSQLENGVLDELGDDRPVSRPWLQDFTASYLGSGNYIPYGPAEVEAQIRALYDNDIHEFLLWNAGNTYTEGVNYSNP
ncbi:LOW QUALITY PROTEIN: glycoside hydrolase [Bacillus sp. JCM 19046]|nr:LOW QUALITY PROTEIN: glycoside hydrolase [Bacillus sp. JCM 19046]